MQSRRGGARQLRGAGAVHEIAAAYGRRLRWPDLVCPLTETCYRETEPGLIEEIA